MKKYTLLVMLFVCCTVVFGKGNGDRMQKRVEYFVNAVVKEYNLSADQKAQLLEKRTTMAKEYQAINKQVKAGELTKEESKEKMRGLNASVVTLISEMSGKSKKELRPFLSQTQKELKNVN